MTMKDRITQAIAAAMRERDQARLKPLRMAKAALMNREVEKGRELDEMEAQQVIAAIIKQRRDSIEQFRQGGREDLALVEAAEIPVLEPYLPPPLDAADIEAAVAEAIQETGAASIKDMGRVMKAVMVRLAGRAPDGKIVSDLVKARLAQ